MSHNKSELYEIRDKKDLTFTLSLGALDYSGKQTAFTPSSIHISAIQKTFTSNNYSPIVWKDNYRLAENFLYATGTCIDSDEGLSIEEALKILGALQINYAMITTRSHQATAHRFRIFIPFNRKIHSLEDYDRIVRHLNADHFPTSDVAVVDGARQLFASPKDATYHAHWTSKMYDVDAAIGSTDSGKRINDAWTDRLSVTTEAGTVVLASNLTEKTIILCPFHEDRSASAFVELSKRSNNHFIFCSACAKTYWKVKPVVPVEDKCSRFYSYGQDVLEVGISGEAFYMSKIGPKKFWVLVDAKDEKEKAEYFNYLVKEKHISHLNCIDHVGDMAADQSYYRYHHAEGKFIVYYAPCAIGLRDNAMVESWLASLFGEHKAFIKQWLAVYVYTNYRKLPTLILKGDRGTGKNTFADTVMAIYSSMSQYWHGEDRSFTPEVQKKLLIADESVSANERQYRMLKQRSGQKYAVVNQKFVPEYQVRNNMNIIVLSNDANPIFVQKDEEPTSELNNQFFVYKMPKVAGPIDPELGLKLEARLGYYIRTELKSVFESIRQMEGCRYSIPVPITPDERALFDMNLTGLEAEAMRIMQKMVVQIDPVVKSFFEKGYFPSRFLDDYTISKGYTKNGVVRCMKEKGYLKPTDQVRPTVKGEREYSYEMTQKLKDWYQEQMTVPGPK